MENPVFSSKQYIDASLLNSFVGALSGNTALLLGCLNLNGGLIHPENLTIATSGLSVSIQTPLSFGVIFPYGPTAGILAQGHGTVGGQDTQTYTASFSGLVPVSGSVTAYLVATYSSIQQAATQIVGPPPGHPDYNPNFQPYTAYMLQTDSMAISATTTAPDNATAFELARASLATGASGVVLNTAYQVRVSGPNTLQAIPVSGSTVIPIGYAGQIALLMASGTYSLLPVSGCDGLVFSAAAFASGLSLIQTQGGDLIYGTPSSPASGVSSFALPQGGSVAIAGLRGAWRIIETAGFQQYVLPTAGIGASGTLGGVRIDGTTIMISPSGVISTSLYTLPTAGIGASGTLGGVRVDGSTVGISASGVISALVQGFSQINIQAFPSSRTYVPTAGMKACIVYGWGSGQGVNNDLITVVNGNSTSLGSLLVAAGGGLTGSSGNIVFPGGRGGVVNVFNSAGESYFTFGGASVCGGGTGLGNGNFPGGGAGGVYPIGCIAGDFVIGKFTAAQIGVSQAIIIGAAAGTGSPGGAGYLYIIEFF